MRILIVEDDPLLGDALQAGLNLAGFSADWLTDGLHADQALTTETYAAIVLDWGLPRLSGLHLLQRLRGRADTTPVLLLTARDTVNDRIEGLDNGADDYLVKPFDLGELAARLRALVRRANGNPAPTLQAGDLTLDPAAHRVTRQGQPVELSTREFALLHALMLEQGKVLSRTQLEEKLYAWGDEIESNAIEVHIHHLRRKIGSDLITTVRGVGYLVLKS